PRERAKVGHSVAEEDDVPLDAALIHQDPAVRRDVLEDGRAQSLVDAAFGASKGNRPDAVREPVTRRVPELVFGHPGESIDATPLASDSQGLPARVEDHRFAREAPVVMANEGKAVPCR